MIHIEQYFLVAMMAMKEINNSTDILPGHRYFLQSMNVVQFWIMFMFFWCLWRMFFVNYTWTQVFFPFFLQWVMFMWIYHTKQLDSSIKWNSWLNSNVTTVWLTFTFSWKSLSLSLENHENCSSFTIDHFLLAKVLLSLSVFVIYVNCGQRASQNQFPGNLNPGAWIFMIKSERRRWREWLGGTISQKCNYFQVHAGHPGRGVWAWYCDEKVHWVEKTSSFLS